MAQIHKNLLAINIWDSTQIDKLSKSSIKLKTTKNIRRVIFDLR